MWRSKIGHDKRRASRTTQEGGESGSAVPGALPPIHVSLGQDHAVYAEPNLWVHHRLA
jgi:hypothetical protein